MEDKLTYFTNELNKREDIEQLISKLNTHKLMILLEETIPSKYRFSEPQDQLNRDLPFVEYFISGKRSDEVESIYEDLNTVLWKFSTLAHLHTYFFLIYEIYSYLNELINPGTFEVNHRKYYTLTEIDDNNVYLHEISGLTSNIKNLLLKIVDENKLKFDDADNIFRTLGFPMHRKYLSSCRMFAIHKFTITKISNIKNE